MTITRHVPWHARTALVASLVVAALAVGVWVGHFGPDWIGADRHAAMLARLEAEVTALRAARDRAPPEPVESRALMDRSTVEALGEQVARLEADNARLKEDIAFFETATADRKPAGKARSDIAIRRFQVVQDRGAHAARYRILVTQDSRAAEDFRGEMRIAVTLQRAGKAVTIDLPHGSAVNAAASSAAVGTASTPASAGDLVQAEGDPSQFRIAFRSYKRIDGSFRFSTDAALKAVQVRIIDRGVVLAQQTVAVA